MKNFYAHYLRASPLIALTPYTTKRRRGGGEGGTPKRKLVLFRGNLGMSKEGWHIVWIYSATLSGSQCTLIHFVNTIVQIGN